VADRQHCRFIRPRQSRQSNAIFREVVIPFWAQGINAGATFRY
jgi:hypothetical protein